MNRRGRERGGRWQGGMKGVGKDRNREKEKRGRHGRRKGYR